MKIALRIVAATIALASLAGFALAARAAPDAARLRVLAHVDPGKGFTADVFAHRDHAYLSSWGGPLCEGLGVRVFDLRDPRNPRQVATFADATSEPDLAGTSTEKTIVMRISTPAYRGDLAAVSLQQCSRDGVDGLGLYDVTNPAAPRRLAILPTTPRGVHELWLHQRGARAFVYGAIPYSELESSPDYDPATKRATIPGVGDLRVIEVTDPTRPRQLAAWGAWRTLKIPPKSQREPYLSLFGHSAYAAPGATRVYVSYADIGTVILDVSRPNRPRYLARTRTTNNAAGTGHSSALANRGRLLIETHEYPGGYPMLYDVTRPNRPRLVGEFKIGPLTKRSMVHDPKVIGNRVFFSWYEQGIVVADISNPRRPRRMAQFVPPARSDPNELICDEGVTACSQVWGVYATPKYVLASDMLSGLWVLRYDEPRTR